MLLFGVCGSYSVELHGIKSVGLVEFYLVKEEEEFL